MKKPTVAAIYTGSALVQPGEQMFREVLPDVRSISLLDNSLIAEVIEEGRMTEGVVRRLFSLCELALAEGADVILETCSSVGNSVDYLAPFFPIPVLRIDRPMVEDVVQDGAKIGVLATLQTTLGPTSDLINQVAREKSCTVDIVSGLAEGAFKAVTLGDTDTHDRLILETAQRMADQCDCIVLAQGSMARMEKTLSEKTGKPIYTSLRRGIEALKAYL